MRKTLLLISAVFAMLAAVSCNKEEINKIDTPQTSVESLEFVAYTDVATKTTLNDLYTEWVEGDMIDINGVAYSTSESGQSVTFTKENEDDENPAAPYFAGYPWNLITNISEGIVNLPNEHNLSAGNICEDVVSIAYSESDPVLQFKNIVSLIKFQVPFEVQEVRISADEALAGEFFVEYNGGEPRVKSFVEDADKFELVLTADEGTFAVETDYYVPVLPGEKTNLTVTIDGTVVAEGKSIEFKRSKIHYLGTLPEAVPVYLVPGQWAADNAWFAISYKDVVAKMERDAEGYPTYNLPSSVTSFSFWRMNPADNWLEESNRWNIIEDVELPQDDATNYYIWESWDAPYGQWGTKPAEKTYSIVGDFNGWGNSGEDIPMEKVTNELGLFVAKNVSALKAFKEWKIRVNDAWDESYGSSISGIQANKWVTVSDSNTSVEADGTYDIYYHAQLGRIYVISSGKEYNVAVQQEESVIPTPEPTGTPVEANHIYLKPSSEWLEANAHFAAWVWADGGSGKLYNFNKHASVDGIYEIEVPATSNNIILFRLDPAKTYVEGSTDWPGDDQWFKSGDIKISGNNLFTIVGWNTINPTKVTEL